MLTKQQYDEIMARLTTHDAWVDTKRGKNGWTSYKPEERESEGIPDVTNEERSAVEVYEFMTDPPTRYFLYISEDKARFRFVQSVAVPTDGRATTWTGEELGRVSFGTPFRSGFGDLRIPVRVYAINGKTYAGTYFKSAGSYARVKMCK